MAPRCVFLIPESEKLSQIQRLRGRMDPLADKLAPHITVVFPCEESILEHEVSCR